MAKRFEGKYALVTGGSSGIGQAICIRMCKEGGTVAVHYGRNRGGAEATVAAIKAALLEEGVPEDQIAKRTLIVGCLLENEPEIHAMFETVLGTFGRLDVLINNSGFQVGTPTHEHSTEDFDKVISVNLRGTFICSREAIKHFLSRPGGGNIVNDTSVHQYIPKPEYPGYAASKAAIGHLTSSMALEYAGQGIRVNAVAPGAIATPMNSAWTEDPAKKAGVCSHIPAGRPGEPEEMAAVFCFMASDEASYVTGQTLYACGGLTLHESFRTAWASE